MTKCLGTTSSCHKCPHRRTVLPRGRDDEVDMCCHPSLEEKRGNWMIPDSMIDDDAIMAWCPLPEAPSLEI